MTRIHPISYAITLGIIALGLAVGIAGADDPERDKNPAPLDWDREQAERDIEAARQSVSHAQTEFLEQFNTGKRKVDDLPVGEVEGVQLAPTTLDDVAALANAILVAKAEATKFKGSGMQDIPATTVTYRVQRVFKGDFHPGDMFSIDFLGGPYRQPSGREVLIQAQDRPFDLPGDRSLLLLGRTADGNYYSLGVAGKFGLRDGTVAERQKPAHPSEWYGKPEAELIEHVSKIAR